VPGRAWRTARQGLARCQQFEHSGRIEHLSAGIGLLRKAAAMTKDPDEAAIIRGNLGTALSRLHRLTGARHALDESIELWAGALASGPLGLDDVAGWSYELRQALRNRYDLAGDRADLDGAIALGALLKRLPPGFRPPATLAAWLSECADDLKQRAESPARAADAVADTEAEIELRRQALRIAPADYPDPAGLLANLGAALKRRAVLTAAEDEPEQTEAILRAAVTALSDAASLATSEHSYAYQVFAQFAQALAVLAVHTGEPEFLEAGITAARRSRTLAPPGDEADGCAAQLALLIAERGRIGTDLMRGAGVDLADMAGAIRLLRQALAELEALSPEPVAGSRAALAGTTRVDAILEDERPSLRTDLAVALRARYLESGDPADLDEAVDLARGAAASPRRAADSALHGEDLNRLGINLQTRYRRTGRLADLQEAVSAHREGIAALPRDDPRRVSYLSSLGLALQLRFEATGNAADLDEAITVGMAAADAFVEQDDADIPAEDRPNYSGLLSNAGIAYRLRAELTGDGEDLDMAVRLARAAVEAAGQDAANRANALHTLGRALLLRSGRPLNGTAARERPRGNSRDLAAALDALRTAARLPGASRQTRLSAAIGWALAAAPEAADCVSDESGWTDAADAYESAVDLLDLVAWHGLPRDVRELQLGRLPGLGCDAAASALACGDLARALSLLARGRSVLWRQLLHLRNDFDELRDADPGLHRQLTELGTALVSDAAPDSGEWGQERERLAAQWDAAIVRARALPGLGGLLRQPAVDELVLAAAHAPVAVLNVSRLRSDALLIAGGKTTVLPLPHVTPDEVRRLALAHSAALDAAARGPRDDPLAIQDADEVLLRVLDWIAGHVTGPVLNELERTGILRETGGHVRWCPTGLLSMLPLHAAAHDRVVSSYVPSLSGLPAAERGTTDADGQRMLIVAIRELPEQLGLARLDGAHDEAVFLAGRFPGRHTRLEDRDATRRRVLDALPTHALAHFSCHGLQSQKTPAQSALQLHDERLTVADLAQARLSGTLAFLSACDTAAGAVALPDEAIHLAAAVQVAGFEHVVAALWPIADDVTADLTMSFYERLVSSGRVDAGLTAAALHAAVSDVKTRFPRRPSLWGAYAHFGP